MARSKRPVCEHIDLFVIGTTFMSEPHGILTTGNSDGIGLGLTQEYLDRRLPVYGISRRGCPVTHAKLRDMRCDLSQFDQVGNTLHMLLNGVTRLSLVVLNAGVLGDIKELHQIPIADIKQIMDVNLWANKAVMDWLHSSGIQIDQIVFMSSGAAVNASKGWGGYALSKAALNMLAKLYVHEFPDSHITAFAPGIVHTQMLDHINHHVNANEFPSAKVLQEAIGTDSMPEPREASKRLAEAFEKLLTYPSGSFLDIRTMMEHS